MENAKESIFDCGIDAVSWSQVEHQIKDAVESGKGHYITVCNVHSVVTARTNRSLKEAINGALLAVPDGMPLVWLLKRRGTTEQTRINGPDLMLRICKQAADAGWPIFLFGGREDVLARLTARLRAQYPTLTIAGAESPPFRQLSDEEDSAFCMRMRESRARVIFVGLGCPKQEEWIARNHQKTPGVMIGVGAAFDYHAGVVKRAPKWMQEAGLEWLARLAAEPRRLFRRYFVTNSIFLGRYGFELISPTKPISKN